MFLESYCQIDDQKISFTRQQASDFAKKVANDFNPLHDVDAKRFCVPGDLLFALILEKSGLSQKMTFTFSGMVSDGIALNFPNDINGNAFISDDNGKEYLSVSANGETTKKEQAIAALTKAYVEFSGQTFPHILVKLMEEQQVMINPSRPMVMYESMAIEIDTFDYETIELSLAKTTLNIEGKRGIADLSFNLIAQDKVIGHGKKHMILSGLRPYEQNVIEEIVELYNSKKANFIA